MPHDRMLATRNTYNLDPEVHLPRRDAAVGRRRSLGSPNEHTRLAHGRHVSRCDRITPRRCGCGGGSGSSSAGEMRVAALGFDEVFPSGCGSCYLAYSEAGFLLPVTSMWYQWTFAPTGKWASMTPDRRRRTMNFVVVLPPASLADPGGGARHPRSSSAAGSADKQRPSTPHGGIGFVAGVAAVAAGLGTGDLFSANPVARSRRGVGACDWPGT